MKHGFQWAGFYALAAIVLVLFLDFRSPIKVLMALAPLAVGLALALGVMGLCGFTLNPANMIALPLVLGVGVDNGVHVLHDYLSRNAPPGTPYRLSRSTGSFAPMLRGGTRIRRRSMRSSPTCGGASGSARCSTDTLVSS